MGGFINAQHVRVRTRKKKVRNGEQEDARVCSARHLNMLRTKAPHDQYSGDAEGDKGNAGMH